MTRRIPSTIRLLAAVAAGLLVQSGMCQAGDNPSPSSEQQTQAEAAPEQRPLSPPPGISIMPSQPWMAPPQADSQVPGCPARNLKPLELLV